MKQRRFDMNFEVLMSLTSFVPYTHHHHSTPHYSLPHSLTITSHHFEIDIWSKINVTNTYFYHFNRQKKTRTSRVKINGPKEIAVGPSFPRHSPINSTNLSHFPPHNSNTKRVSFQNRSSSHNS